MSDDRSKDEPDSKPGGAAAAPGRSAAEPGRARQIEQLERTLVDERAHSASLRSSVNELKFQMEILDKSYAKQLDDARQRAEAAEQNADRHRLRVVELDQAREDAIALLTEAKAEIDRLATERNRLNRQVPTRDGWPIGADATTAAADATAAAADTSADAAAAELYAEGTINTLLDDAKWVRDKAPDEQALLKGEADARAAEQSAQEEMISPDLVFTARAADN